MPLNQIAFDFDSLPPVAKQEEVKIIVAEEKVIEQEAEVVDLTLIPPQKLRIQKKDNKKQTRGRMSLKDMDAGVDLIEIPEDEVLFQKMY